jgi:alpha-glucosidase (family GH31 glycosyl hydrolase)
VTLDADAVHSWNSTSWLEYDVHNLYGLSESIVTNAILERQMGARSLLVTRSTFSGSGRHAAVWLGDNWSTFASMAASIPGVLSMQFFGLPLVGADICGFNGRSDEELCARWMALGSFYPFARNHNAKGNPPQEPYVWASVAAVSRKTLAVRYSLLHVYNTLFFHAHMQGGTVARALFLNFPQDTNTFTLGAQFMIGSVLLVTPVLTRHTVSVTGYFPPRNDAGLPQRWFDLWSGEELVAGSTGWVELPAPLDTIPLHFAGGSVIPIQAPALTTVAQRHNPFKLIVAPDSTGSATGSLFLDDGASLQVGVHSTQASVQYANGTLRYALWVNSYAPAAALQCDDVELLGMPHPPTAVTLNGNALPGAQIGYKPQAKIVSLTQLALPLSKPFTITFSF